MNSKTVQSSETTMTELIMPNDTNPMGNLMGGNLLRWMDIAAGITAARHCGRHVVTASVDNVSFRHPIHIGEIVTIRCAVTRAFRTSLEVHVEVNATGITDQSTRRTNHAYFTFVGVDSHGKPSPVPQLNPESEKEKSDYEGALKRRELRLLLAGRIKPEEASGIQALFTKES